MDQIGNYMLQIGTVAALVFGATEGLAVVMRQTGLSKQQRGKVKMGFALVSGVAGTVIAQGAGFIHVGPEVSQGWALAMAGMFGMLGTLLAMGGNGIRNTIKRGRKGKLPK